MAFDYKKEYNEFHTPPKKPGIISIVMGVYAICFVFRVLEYFFLRTDQTVLGEAFIHKLIGIVILFVAAKYAGFSCENIGFSNNNVLKSTLKGLGFGLSVFALAYSVEIIILAVQGRFASMSVFVSAYSVDGNIGNQTAFIFFVMCIVGNIINVVMEEGMFRGLFQKILERKYSFVIAAVIASSLFGLWHIMSPLRSYCDGAMSTGGFVANSVMLITTSALVGFKFAMMTKLTGNLYMAMGDHFVNNTIVNVLHVISDTGADQLQVVRISIAQSVSFVIVLVWYMLKKKEVMTNAV